MKTRGKRHGGAVALLVLVVVGTAVAEGRTWTSADGKFQVEAELLSVQDGKVILRKADGAKVAVPLTKLSAPDQQFAAGRPSRTAALVPVTDGSQPTKSNSVAVKPPASKVNAATGTLSTLREIAEKFYGDLRTKDQETAVATLTDEAQQLAADEKSSLASLPSPEANL